MMLVMSLVVAGPCIDINWDPAMQAQAKELGFDRWLEDHAAGAAATVTFELGISLSRKIELTVHSAQTYRSRFGQQQSDFAWAHYQDGQIHINGGLPIQNSFNGLLVHEMVHAILDYQDSAQRLPRWVNEGLAENFEAVSQGIPEIDQVQRIFLKDALRQNDVPELNKLGRPSDATQYLVSHAAVRFAFDSMGKQRVLDAVAATLKGGEFDSEWRKATGRSLADFDRAFRNWIRDFDG